ncbi:MAG TPA: DUF4198 domain-containing protein [Reyranella sp.]
MRLICIFAATLLWAGTASAHHLWLEPDGPGARIYFGEFDENLREASPGLLDRFKPLPEAKAVGASARPLKVEKTPNAFTVSGTVSAGDSIVAEQSMVSERKQGDKPVRTLGTLAARWVPDFAERAPTLTLDVVPTGKPGAFKVVYDGKPLPKAKLELKAESGWQRELRTDEQGVFTADLPWRGTYVIEIEHVDAKAGGEGAGAYDRKRFVTSLSFKAAQGLEGPPAPPLVVPKRAMKE